MQFPELEYHSAFNIAKLKSNTSIAYTDEGKGEEVLLFIHGLASYIPSWKKNTTALSSKFRCIAIDLPGFGKSQQGVNSGNMNYYAQIVHEFIDELKLKNVTIIGHSMGGQIALNCVLSFSDDIKKIILLAPAGLEVFTGFDKFLMFGTYDDQMVCNGSDEQIKKNMEINFYKMPADAGFMIDDAIKMKSCKNFSSYREVINNSINGMIAQTLSEKLNLIDKPVLIIFGENDYLIPNKLLHKQQTINTIVKESVNKLPNAAYLIIPECGHYIQFEKPATVNSAITDFIEKK